MPSRSPRRARSAATLQGASSATLAVLTALALVAASVGVAAAADPPRSADDEILIRYASGTTAAERRDIARAHRLTHVRASGDGRTEVVVAEGRATATIRRTLVDDTCCFPSSRGVTLGLTRLDGPPEALPLRPGLTIS